MPTLHKNICATLGFAYVRSPAKSPYPKNGVMNIMPEINPQRFMNDLRHLRTIGQYDTGVVRPAFSIKDMEVRQWLLHWMKETGHRNLKYSGRLFNFSRPRRKEGWKTLATLRLCVRHLNSNQNSGNKSTATSRGCSVLFQGSSSYTKLSWWSLILTLPCGSCLFT